MRFITLPEQKESPPTGAEDRKTGAEKARWNLADLYPDLDSMDKDLARAREEAASFEDRFRGQGGNAGRLSTCLRPSRNLRSFCYVLGRVMSYAYLNWCTRHREAQSGELSYRGHERLTPRSSSRSSSSSWSGSRSG